MVLKRGARPCDVQRSRRLSAESGRCSADVPLWTRVLGYISLLYSAMSYWNNFFFTSWSLFHLRLEVIENSWGFQHWGANACIFLPFARCMGRAWVSSILPQAVTHGADGGNVHNSLWPTVFKVQCTSQHGARGQHLPTCFLEEAVALFNLIVVPVLKTWLFPQKTPTNPNSQKSLQLHPLQPQAQAHPYWCWTWNLCSFRQSTQTLWSTCSGCENWAVHGASRSRFGPVIYGCSNWHRVTCKRTASK